MSSLNQLCVIYLNLKFSFYELQISMLFWFLFQRKENKLPKLLGVTDKDPTELFCLWRHQAFVMLMVTHHLVRALKWILLMWKNRKSDIKRAAQLKYCIVRGGIYGRIPLDARQYADRCTARQFCCYKIFRRCRSRFAGRFNGESAKLVTMRLRTQPRRLDSKLSRSFVM